ncbi:MAG: hypothetical protein J6L24_00565 [Oscillospiraceae bacterium]|nr:hypothetical protein [Oscillospiraceae bacterium]
MKKLLILALAACLVFSMAACGTNTPNETAGSTAAGASEPAVNEAFVFTYNGTKIQLHANMAPILAALGEPKRYTESASCAFEGLDKTYYYGSFYIDTYPMGDQDYVFDFWFADDSVATAEGICIGSAKAQVEAAYGADKYNGSNAYIVTEGDGRLTVILEEGVVTSIQYSVVLS